MLTLLAPVLVLKQHEGHPLDICEDGANSPQEEDEEGPLGVPADIPIEFTRYASLKPKELFKYAVDWMLQKHINPAFEKRDPLYDLTFRKLDDEAQGLAGSKFTSSAWTPAFKYALEARPQMEVLELDSIEMEDHEKVSKANPMCALSSAPAIVQYMNHMLTSITSAMLATAPAINARSRFDSMESLITKTLWKSLRATMRTRTATKTQARHLTRPITTPTGWRLQVLSSFSSWAGFAKRMLSRRIPFPIGAFISTSLFTIFSRGRVTSQPTSSRNDKVGRSKS